MPSKASYGQSHMFLAQKLHFVVVVVVVLSEWQKFAKIAGVFMLFVSSHIGFYTSDESGDSNQN